MTIKHSFHHWLNDIYLATQKRLKWPSVTESNVIRFRCNICSRAVRALPSRLTREEVTCPCGSTVRLRALVHVLSLELFGESYAIPDFPFRADLVGVDMSGAETYARHLTERLSYTNTFLHKAPFLDIVDPSEEWLSRCDFVISSDVFEHVAPPVSRAFENTLRILKPGGILILTVPYAPAGETREHFPELHRYHVMNRNGKKVLVNVTDEGKVQEFDQLVFHGGEGETLEMRVFSESGVLEELERAGFVDIRVHREPYPQFGILWSQPWSLPITARRPER